MSEAMASMYIICATFLIVIFLICIFFLNRNEAIKLDQMEISEKEYYDRTDRIANKGFILTLIALFIIRALSH